MNASRLSASLLVIVGLLAGRAVAVNIETVPVGNPGNVGEHSGEGAGDWGPDHICGAVGYAYNIGKYEVTAGQYTEFLNAVAKTDIYGLYNPNMWSDTYGCKIERTGSSGNYSYSVAPDWANRPVNYVSYWDACRFTNWLHNGQPTGPQDASTTEDGSYALNGYTGTHGETIQRNAGWKWAVTSEDEWYKAAYHKNDGVTGNYWNYPTSSDTINMTMANYGMSVGHTTDVGSYAYPGSYGTFDQGGSVWEWNGATVSEEYVDRGYRGGSFLNSNEDLYAPRRNFYYLPLDENNNVGFRVAAIPEPATLLLLALGVLAMMQRVRRLSAAITPAVLVVLLLSVASARANVFNMPPGLTSLEMVTVGNPGNAPDTRYSAPGYGSVRCEYHIGKYEVTAGQYCEFLKAVAQIDTHGLYHASMSNTSYGSGITQSGDGTVGNPYTYSVAASFTNRPVNYVSYWNACRFANWLHNGQPTGTQGADTTETGAYTLTTDSINNNSVTRNVDWRWAVSSEDEWYKAAYHKNDGATGNYWNYPTGSNSSPGRDLNDASGNNANWCNPSGPYPIDSPYYTTVGGEFQDSDSPYGTFDQGGNVFEWNETVVDGVYRSRRGGAFGGYASDLLASYRIGANPTVGRISTGFRVVHVPEPGSGLLLVGCGAALLARRRLRLTVEAGSVLALTTVILFAPVSLRAASFQGLG